MFHKNEVVKPDVFKGTNIYLLLKKTAKRR